jgi:hypothetical protein
MYKIGLTQINSKTWLWYIMHERDSEYDENILFRGKAKSIRKALKDAHKHVSRSEVGSIYLDRRMGWE